MLWIQIFHQIFDMQYFLPNNVFSFQSLNHIFWRVELLSCDKVKIMDHAFGFISKTFRLIQQDKDFSPYFFWNFYNFMFYFEVYNPFWDTFYI